MSRPRALRPLALAGALLLGCAAGAEAEVMPRAVPGASALPSGPMAHTIDAADELVVIDATTRPVSVSERLRVHVEGPAGAPTSMFELVPNRRLFSRLPVSGVAGLGGVLRDEPFAERAVWLGLMVSNQTDDDFFSLVGDGQGFAPSAMVIVSQDGSVTWYSGVRLDALRHQSSVGDATSYRFMLLPGQRCAIYMRLDGHKFLGPGLRIWPASLLAAGERVAVWLVGLLIGIAVASCLVLCFMSGTRSMHAERHVDPLRRAFAASAFASLALGLRGGGLGAVLAGQGLPRFLSALVLGIAALVFDAAASIRAGGSRHHRTALLYRVVVGLVAVVGSCLSISPAVSFILPGYLLGLLCLLAGRTIIESIRAAGVASSDVALLRERLRQESDEGRSFMTATAMALSGPLHGIVGMLEDIDALLSELPLVSRNAVADIGLARAEAARIDTIVSNMQSYADGGVAGLSAEDFDLASIVGAAANLLRLAYAGQVLHIDASVPIIEMKSDVRLVRQLLYNALHWAVRNGSSRVAVQATSTDEWSRIQIKDDGPVFPAGNGVSVPAGDAAAQDMDSAVMTRLAGLLGGEVSYHSDGARNALIVDLPRWIKAPVSLLEPSASLLADAGHAQTANPHGAAGRILAAGNEPVMLLAVKRRLEASGWEVVATVSARDALARVMGEESYDLVIVDSVMPEMSGFEFCASIRSSRGPESVPVIILVESGRPDEIERSFKAGANDYIARPASGLELAARVKTHVDLASSIRRELAQAARMAELDKYRTLAMLSAGVAHEINTPNNAVLRTVPMLKEIWSVLDVVIDRINREEGGFSVRGFGYDDLKSDVPDMLNDLYMGAQDIRRIVEGLKDYARAPSEAEELSPVDVNEVVQYAMRLLRHSIVVATDRCTLSLQDSLPHIQADRLKLTQVVVNVLENALQALPDRSRGLTIATLVEPADGQGESIVVRIVDDGIGMSAETLASVFDPFFTTKRDKGGSGLGMAVVSGIVHDMGGSIALRSEIGAGTTVTIRIPVRPNAKGDDDGE